MARRESVLFLFAVVLVLAAALPANAQSFRVQCPTSTITHPAVNPNSPTQDNNSEPSYLGPTTFTNTNPTTPANGYLLPSANVNGAIRCQQISGGDGLATMADGTQTYIFSFGPLSGLSNIASGLPGTTFPNVFNTMYPGSTLSPTAGNMGTTSCSAGAFCKYLLPGDPATTAGASDSGGAYDAGIPSLFTYNGAVGLQQDVPFSGYVFDASNPSGTIVTIVINSPVTSLNVGDQIIINGVGGGYDGTFAVTKIGVANSFFGSTFAFQYDCNLPLQTGGISCAASVPLAEVNLPGGDGLPGATASSVPLLDGHVDPRQIIDVGVMNGNIPAPLMAFDEDDEFFLTLSNVGMIMRPDLFEQHTVHFHGYPNASSVYDGVPDASVAINIGGSFTYYYLAPDAGTYFWHCHITPPEHLQMGMVGQLYVRPRQNRVPLGNSLYTALQFQNGQATGQTVVDLRTVCNPAFDILCSTVTPSTSNSVTRPPQDGNGVQTALCSGAAAPASWPYISKYVYNDGDGSTCYDREYPLQIHGFDPNFHFVGMTFNPEAFADMKDKYFLLNGRSYPDTVTPGPMATQTTDGRMHYSQPLPAIIDIPVGGRALLRIADLDVSEYQTLASLGIRMHMIGFNAKLLRDQAGNNLDYYTNSITLGGGESLDVILDVSDAACGGTSGCGAAQWPNGSTFFLYTPNLDHLSNDAENFGGLMTTVCVGTSDPVSGVCKMQ